jgi:hypothetical protein
MAQTEKGRQMGPLMDDGTGLTEVEIALREGGVLLGAALLGLARAADAVLEAWPLPTSRTRK